MAVAVHMLGSLWFAVGDSPRGWVTEEGLHEQPLTRQYTRSFRGVRLSRPVVSPNEINENNIGQRFWVT